MTARNLQPRFADFSVGSPLALTMALLLLLGSARAQSGDDEFNRVLDQFETLETLAGRGQGEDDNFWQPQFEGAPATEVELSNPHMTMADAAGNYYIADKESHAIVKIDPEGRLHTFAGTHENGETVDEGLATEVPLDNPNGVYVRPDGIVYILDFFNRRIRKVDMDGWLTTLVTDPDGFGPGRALWVAPDEDLIYFNGSGSVKRWTQSGGIEILVNDVLDPGNIAVDDAGHLYITDRGAHRVFKIDPSEAPISASELQSIAGDGSTGDAGDEPSGLPATDVALDSVRGIALFPGGGYFLATQKGGDIWYVDSGNVIHKFIAGAGSGNIRAGDGEPLTSPGDKIAEPRAIAFAPNGDLLITCNDTGYVRRVIRRKTAPRFPFVDLGPDGMIQLIWPVEPGQSVELEASVDLAHWTQLETEALPHPTDLEFAIPKGPDHTRFFRLRPR